jgi:hypothetical protein
MVTMVTIIGCGNTYDYQGYHFYPGYDGKDLDKYLVSENICLV